jgi:hypothetical protein
VLLSGGMPGDRFVAAFRASLAAGARGYLAGRAVWWEAVQAYPDMARIRQALETEGVRVLRALNQALAAVPPGTVGADWRLPVAQTWAAESRTSDAGRGGLQIAEQATDHGTLAAGGSHA